MPACWAPSAGRHGVCSWTSSARHQGAHEAQRYRLARGVLMLAVSPSSAGQEARLTSPRTETRLVGNLDGRSWVGLCSVGGAGRGIYSRRWNHINHHSEEFRLSKWQISSLIPLQDFEGPVVSQFSELPFSGSSEDPQRTYSVKRSRTVRVDECRSARQESAPDGASLSALRRPVASFQPPRMSTWLPGATAQTHLQATLTPALKFWVITVSTSEMLLAAATLRAQIFYTYPQYEGVEKEGVEGIKERMSHSFFVKDLLKSKTRSEFNRESKMQFLGMRVKCLLAVCEKSNLEALLLSTPKDESYTSAMPSIFSPPEVAWPELCDSKGFVAIGTLDIQDGTGSKPTADVNLVTFQLYSMAHLGKQQKQVSKGKNLEDMLPIEEGCALQQGYIFNLCVIETVRRQGVARALMEEALQVAKQMELKILYVHVEADNPAALALYKGLGYALEEEEPMEVETRLKRPRRLLLSFWVL